MVQTVVITGASAGIGRATARYADSGKQPPPVVLLDGEELDAGPGGTLTPQKLRRAGG